MGKFKTRKNSLRLQGYDYRTPGYYFVTISSYQSQHLFGEIHDKKMNLNQLGEIVKYHWLLTPGKSPIVELDEFIIMPNHLHAIIRILNTNQIPVNEDPTLKFAKAHSLSVLMRTFKASVTKTTRKTLSQPSLQIWHRSFNDHILRDDESLDAVRFYIRSNPTRWENEKNVY